MAAKKATTQETEENVVVMEEKTQRAPKNAMEMLLGADVGALKLPTKQYEIPRLTAAFGAPFIITLKALSAEKWEEVQDMALNIKGKDVDVDNNLLQTFIVMESTYEDEEATKLFFKNKELMAKFNAATPKELVKKILISGEIVNVYGEVSNLSGFGDDAVTEVKN